MYILSQIINWLKTSLSHIMNWLKMNPVKGSLIHGLLLMLMTFSWVNQSLFTLGKELSLIQITSGVKHLLLGMETKPESEDFLFVNTAYDRKLIEKKDKNNSLLGNEDITDREKLARFFHILNSSPESCKFVLCDIFFRDPSPDDALLRAEMSKMKNILIPYSKYSSDEWENPIFNDIPKGIVDYTTGDAKGTFLKFRLTETDRDIMHKSIPLLMYEKLYNAKFGKCGLLYFMNGKLSLNAMVPNFRIQNRDIDNYPKLWEILNLPEPFMLEMVKNRIIVIGDFTERDMHETIFGEMPGPLLLVNAYLSIVKGDHLISPLFLICLFAVYTMISYYLFYGKRLEEYHIDIRFGRRFFYFIGKPLSYGLMLGIVSVVLYLIFNVHINILLIAVYLSLMDYLLQGTSADSYDKFGIDVRGNTDRMQGG